MTEFHQTCQTISGFMKISKTTVIHVDANASSQVRCIGRRKRSQLKSGRTRI